MSDYVLFTSLRYNQRPTDDYAKDSGDDAEIRLVPMPFVDDPTVAHQGRTRVHIWLPKLPEYEITLWLDEIMGATT